MDNVVIREYYYYFCLFVCLLQYIVCFMIPFAIFFIEKRTVIITIMLTMTNVQFYYTVIAFASMPHL